MKPSLEIIAQMPKADLRTILEHDFAVAVREYAEKRGWMVWYTRTSASRGRDGVWRGISPKGEPDHRFARAGVYLAAELKTEMGKLRPDQETALEALGEHGHLWRPRDSKQIMEVLL